MPAPHRRCGPKRGAFPSQAVGASECADRLAMSSGAQSAEYGFAKALGDLWSAPPETRSFVVGALAPSLRLTAKFVECARSLPRDALVRSRRFTAQVASHRKFRRDSLTQK